ncbi:MAG: trypsin-like peptidase domain-containing protein [Chloroflexi bacterium]|nr:trypsin-like peptidase domain-containing protein [Chloroflexota bacterium]
MNAFQSLSDDMADSVARAAQSAVAVYGRAHVPGTGIVWSADGYIVTADHVLQRDEEITVALPDGASVAATVVGRDPANDLALLKAEADGLTPGEWLPLDSLRVGQLVLALGRPGREAVSATLGVVSAVGKSGRSGRRRLEAYVQTDVVMYPGYSGGPLVAPGGKVAGLNSSALARGASLALPWETVNAVATALKQHGRMRRGYLGVGSNPVRLAQSLALAGKLGQSGGLLLQSVEPGSPAERGGLLQGGILVGMAGAPVEGMDDLQAALGPEAVGKAVVMKVIRGGELRELTVTVGERE